jgi:hypothetical protein
MVKSIRIICDVKTMKVWEEEYEFTPPTPYIEQITINLDELKKLIDYAKKMGWLK